MATPPNSLLVSFSPKDWKILRGAAELRKISLEEFAKSMLMNAAHATYHKYNAAPAVEKEA
jgi:hypothetical protein